MERLQAWEEWQICFNKKPPSIFLEVSLTLDQITCQGPKCTNRPWLPWSASPGTSTHTHRGPLLQELHLSSSLQSASLLFLHCFLYFLVWPWMWLVTLPSLMITGLLMRPLVIITLLCLPSLGMEGLHPAGEDTALLVPWSSSAAGFSCLLDHPCCSLTLLKLIVSMFLHVFGLV